MNYLYNLGDVVEFKINDEETRCDRISCICLEGQIGGGFKAIYFMESYEDDSVMEEAVVRCFHRSLHVAPPIPMPKFEIGQKVKSKSCKELWLNRVEVIDYCLQEDGWTHLYGLVDKSEFDEHVQDNVLVSA